MITGERMKATTIMPAAGRGERMGGEVDKQFLSLWGRPILSYTLEVFENCASVNEVILVVPEEQLHFCSTEIVEKFGFGKVKKVVPGGPRRQDSVYEGLKVVEDASGMVAIHDGVRPFVSPGLIAESVERCKEYGAVIVAVKAKDTLKEGRGGFVDRTLVRENLWLVQTPQIFDYDLILRAYRKAEEDGFYGSDDSSLVERMGHRVKIIEGSYENIKITTPEDLTLAGWILSRRGEQNAGGFRL